MADKIHKGKVKSIAPDHEEPDGMIYIVMLEGVEKAVYSSDKFEVGEEIEFTSKQGANKNTLISRYVKAAATEGPKEPEAPKTAVALPNKPMTLQNLLSQVNVKERFQEVLGDNAAGFISSLISCVKANPDLQKCEPITIISSAMVAASLKLSIVPSIGEAAIVPYKTSKKTDAGWMDVYQAQFQMMYKGFTQLAQRTGLYRTINVAVVYEGELVKENRFTGDYEFDADKRTGDKIIGYVSYFRLLTGFEKYVYWTVEQCKAHGLRYSKSYANEKSRAKSRWEQDFDAMALKTVLKLNLDKYGPKSIEIQKAKIADQGIFKDLDTIEPEYPETGIDEGLRYEAIEAAGDSFSTLTRQE